MKVYAVILQGSEATESNAKDFALNFDFSEVETYEDTPIHTECVDTINGIAIFYQYRADYYLFAEEE